MADKATSELQLVVSLKDEMSSNLKKLGGIIAGAFAVDKIVAFGKAAVQAAMDEQAVHTKLATLLGNVKGAREGDYQALIQQAEALKNLTGAQDEEIVNAQAMLATDQLTGEQIQKLIPGILDMASANAQVGESFGDISGAAVAVGKAFTVGAGALSRYNITMSDSEKKAFDLADKNKKLDIITQALNDNFGGAAVAAGETYQGRVNKVQNAVDDLQKSIGKALMPTVDMLSGQLLNSIGTIDSTTGAQEGLSRGIYQGTNFIIALGKSLYLVIQAIVGFGLILWDVAKVVFDFDKAVVGAFFNIKDNVMVIIKALGKALKGDFDGAMDDLGNAVKKGLADTSNSLNQLIYDSKGVGASLGDQWASIGDSMLAAVDLKGYKPMADAAGKAGKKMAEVPKEAAKGAKELSDALGKMTGSYKDLKQKGAVALQELADSHREKMSSIRSEMDKTKKSISDLQNEYNKGFADDTQSVAEEVIKTEQHIADLKAQIADEEDAKKRQALQSQLDKEQQALTDSAGFTGTIQAQITEARRRAGLTDLQRAIEDFKAKRLIAQQEFDSKMIDLSNELNAIRAKEAEEVSLYNAKTLQIKELMDKADIEYAKAMDKRHKNTVDTVNAEIKLYTDLAAAIAAAQSASTAAAMRTSVAPVLSGKRAAGGPVGFGEVYLVGEKGPELFVPNSSGNIVSNDKLSSRGGANINVVITGNTISNKLNIRDIADQVSGAIVGQLRLNARV
jgi:hypothetical protein